MEWRDDGIILGARPHGESHAMVEIFCASAGRWTAMVHGGQSRTKQPILQSGNEVQFTWRGRHESQTGHFIVELSKPHAAKAMGDPLALLALSACCHTLSALLPERDAEPQLFEATKVLLANMEEPDLWPILYAKWELGLLEALGAGLDLKSCAATGQLVEDGASLAFMSPKTARAVSIEAGLPYQDRLLPLPTFLIDQGDPQRQDIPAALKMTGYFIEQKLFAPAHKSLPEARAAFLKKLDRWAKG